MLGRVLRTGALAGASAGRLFFPGRDRYDTIVIELDGDILEDISAPGLMRYFLPRRTLLRDLLFALDDVAHDDRVWGLVVLIREPTIGWAQVQELREAIAAVNASGVRTFAYLESAGNLDYYLACACDEVLMAPSGEIAVRGLASEVTFFADALDKVSVQADFENIGHYKSAAEHFTRRSMSKFQREEVTSLLDGLTDQLVRGIAEARDLKPAKVYAHIDVGGFMGGEAVQAGLVDATLYEDEVDDYLSAKKGEAPRVVGWGQYALLRQIQRGPLALWRATPTFALMYATGPLTMGDSTGGAMGRDTTGARTMVEALRSAREDARISGILFRIDSPGGGVLASDLIWREVHKAAEQKPVVVSCGDMAASGGYYIAAPGQAIFANPGSLTGSIGIIAGKINLKGLYDRLGIRKEVITRGKMARFDSEYGGFSSGERKLLRHQMEESYSLFLDRVADGRELTRAAVKKVAEGRVWLGEQAKDKGLVDGLGGLLAALAELKKRVEVPEEQRVQFALYPRRRKFFTSMAGFLPVGGREGLGGLWSGVVARAAAETLPRGVGRDLGHLFRLADLAATERVLALMAYGLRIE